VAFFFEKYKIVALNVRGHGRSDKQGSPCSIDRFARDAAGPMKGLGVFSQPAGIAVFLQQWGCGRLLIDSQAIA